MQRCNASIAGELRRRKDAMKWRIRVNIVNKEDLGVGGTSDLGARVPEPPHAAVDNGVRRVQLEAGRAHSVARAARARDRFRADRSGRSSRYMPRRGPVTQAGLR